MEDWEYSGYRPDALFEEIFRCLPFSKYKYPHLETGNKIIMPPSALTRINIARLKFPLIFAIEGFRSDKISHCGVLEFEAEEGFVHMPDWMMKNLDLKEGAHVTLRGSSLSSGNYLRLQPHTTSFIELPDPKAVLETALRGFSCLSRGDTILIRNCDREFYIDVVGVAPGDAVSLIDTDCEVDFAPPLDYREPPKRQGIVKKVNEKEKDVKEKGEEKKVNEKEKDVKEKEEEKKFRPFMGRGRRMDGGVVGGGCAAARAVVKDRKRKRDGGDDRKDVFRPFTGLLRVGVMFFKNVDVDLIGIIHCY